MVLSYGILNDISIELWSKQCVMENDECGLDTTRCGIDIMFGLCSTHALHGPVVEWGIRHSLTLQRRDT